MQEKNEQNINSFNSDEIRRIDEFRLSNHTALLTIVFTDIVGSTHAAETLGDADFLKLKFFHDELFQRIMCQHGEGIVIKEIGDAFLCVFGEPSKAVLRAIEFQREIYHNRKELTIKDFTLRVRIGIHLGQVVINNNLSPDIFGTHVNRASRITAASNSGLVLTSQSIWENAGWLKQSSSENNIGAKSYGKIRLKGIIEPVEVFGFYPRELPKPKIPRQIVFQKWRRAIAISITLVFLGLVSFFIVLKSPSPESLGKKSNKSYFVRIDFSNILGRNEVRPRIDTNALKANLLAQVITVFYPDTILTDVDLSLLFSRTGNIYSPRILLNNGTRHLDNLYYDSLDFNGTLFIQPAFSDSLMEVENLVDSILIRFNFQEFDSMGTHSISTIGEWSVNNVVHEFRNHLNELVIQMRMRQTKGSIVNLDDSIILFKVSGKEYLRNGLNISVSRKYTKEEGLKTWLTDTEKRIQYFKSNRAFFNSYEDELLKLEHIKNVLAESILEGSTYGDDTEIRGTIIEIHDSIVKATWKNTGIYSLERPRVGDEVSLSF